MAESGVIIDDPLPEGYQWFITELPNTPSRPDLTVGQCLTSDDRPRHLKIPLVFTPELGGYVEIVAGTPIVQYLPVLIPELELVKDGLRTTKVDNVDEAGVTAARRAAGCPI